MSQSQRYRVVEPCGLPGPGSINSLLQIGTVICELAQIVDLIVERNDFYAIGRFELLDKSGGRALDLVELLLSTRAGIQHQHDVKRLADRRKKHNLLFDSVLVNREVLAAHVGDVSFVAITGDHRDGYQGRLELDRFFLLITLLFWAGASFGSRWLSLFNRLAVRRPARSLAKTHCGQEKDEPGGTNATRFVT